MKTIWRAYYKKRKNLDPFHGEYIRRRLTAFFGLLIILIMTSACNTQPANNNKLEIEITQAIRIGLFLPTKHKNQIVKDNAKNYYNSAKLAAEDLRPMPLEIILYETDGTLETIQKKAEEAVNDDIQIAIGTLDNEEALSLASILKVSGKKLLSFSAISSLVPTPSVQATILGLLMFLGRLEMEPNPPILLNFLLPFFFDDMFDMKLTNLSAAPILTPLFL